MPKTRNVSLADRKYVLTGNIGLDMFNVRWLDRWCHPAVVAPARSIMSLEIIVFVDGVHGLRVGNVARILKSPHTFSMGYAPMRQRNQTAASK